jgi:glycosyltransferase involved in cell wall biosynthesis
MTDHSRQSGFGGVAHNVCFGLSEAGFEMYFLGWGFHADGPMPRANYLLLPTANAPFANDVLPFVLQQLKPEAMIVQADVRMIMYIPQMLSQIPNKPSWILYPVIDGNVWDVEGKNTKWPSNWTGVIKAADKVVAMTKYGQKILHENGIESDVIYHGVDTTLFKPVSTEAKEQIKTSAGVSKDSFIFGGVFKNMQRKNPEAYLQAFRILLESKGLSQKEKENLKLLLHTQPQPGAAGEFDLIQQAVDYGLEPGKNLLFSTAGLPSEAMPFLFQSMDVYMQLGGMEGFCLPIIEAMSCGLPVIAIDSATHKELIGDTGIIVDLPTFDGKHKITYGSYNGVECDIADPWAVAKQMEKLYKDASLRKELGFKATERAIKEFDWGIIRKKWIELVKTQVITEDQIPAEWAKLYAETKV